MRAPPERARRVLSWQARTRESARAQKRDSDISVAHSSIQRRTENDSVIGKRLTGSELRTRMDQNSKRTVGIVNDFLQVGYFNNQAMFDSPQNSPPSTLGIHQENVGGTTYFYSTNSENLNSSASTALGPESCLGPGIVPSVGAVSSPYASQMYPPTPTHITMPAKSGLASSFYMPEVIRSELYHRNEEMFFDTDVNQYPDVPENVEIYSDLSPLEGQVPHSMATSYRATHRQSAEHFALRRLHSFSCGNAKRLELWKKIDHPNIVKLHDYFVTKAFHDHSLILVYDYHPGCVTLMNKYLSGGVNAAGSSEYNGISYHDPFSSDPDAPRPYTHQKNALLRAVASGALLPEAVLWSLLVQLTAGLRAIHSIGLACRHVFMMQKPGSNESYNERMPCMDCVVRYRGCSPRIPLSPVDVIQAQQDDLTALGRLALALACRAVHCDNLSASMDLITRTYSADLKNLILFNLDASWSETGNRYMLKLFRDYIFHAVAVDGRPWLDQGHITYCLNQLDSGSNNKVVVLMSRDERSVLVVTFAELKHCLEQAFEEVYQAAGTMSGLP
ncbi:PAN2-PAN3 deadenylation complex subunit PAN3 [Eumeta japonica]|uniref:PAN2-PAN3 deadenylation complex subunit PAN3 n=1 Tax=Eumeta variegata TaxID=151549 RepID=A0A4C2AFT4_EUMVA|nr:PAN2-PAN3 deadenylation complex subunit PAN3 [Eumeta japonica]